MEEFVGSSILPPLPGQAERAATVGLPVDSMSLPSVLTGKFYDVARIFTTPPAHFKWEDEWEEMVRRESESTLPLVVNDESEDSHTARVARKLAKPIVDYTNGKRMRFLLD